MDKIRAMQLLIRIVELESFSRIMDTLGPFKGNVSRRIQALENHLGTQLLHRIIRRVQLTQDGVIYYGRAKDLLSSLDELDGLFHHDPSSISGKLRVDVPVGVARSPVTPHLPSFLHQHLGLGPEFSSSNHLADLTRGGFDCVVRMGALRDSGLIVCPLGKLTQINYAGLQCLAHLDHPESLKGLASHVVMHYPAGLGMRAQSFEVATESGTQQIKTGGILMVNSTETYRAACLADLGITQASHVGMRDALHAGTLVEVLPQYRARSMPTSLLYPHRRSLSRRVRLFVGQLTDMMKDYVDWSIFQDAPLSGL